MPPPNAPREGRIRRDQADDAEHAARGRDVRDLEAERAGAAIDEHDAAGELTRQRTGWCPPHRRRPMRLPPACRRVEHRAFDGGRQRRGPGLEHRAASPVTGASSVMSCSVAEGTAVCATLSAEDAAAGEPVMNCLSALLPAEATVSTPSVRGVVDRGRQIVIERLAVRRTQRHVDDVDVVADAAVAVRIEREIHRLEQRDAAARSRGRGARLERVQLRARSHAQLAGDDVGDVRAVTAERGRVGSADRIRIRVEQRCRLFGQLSPTKSYPPITLALGNRPSSAAVPGSSMTR